MRRLTVVGLIALCSFFLTAVEAGSPAGASKPAVSQSEPHARVSDVELESKLHAKLAKSKIGKDGFTVHVKSGVVTWEGKTDVIQHKGAATRMARTAGALEVVNNIKISDEGRQRASGNFSGGPKRAQVKVN